MELRIVWLLRAAWAAGIFPIIVASLPISMLSSFQGTILGFARRGKIMRSYSSKFTVPQRFFSHFYVLAVIWTTLLLVTTWIYAFRTTPIASERSNFPDLGSQLRGISLFSSWSTSPNHRQSAWRAVFLLILMECQVLRRLIESKYVFKYSPSARMHILGYLTGLFFYTAAPLSLCAQIIPEVAIFAVNLVTEMITEGKRQIAVLQFDWWQFLSPPMKLGLMQWIGAAIYLWGWIHQRRCHAILGCLRKRACSNDEYVIPHGDWFHIVSSPHYLAEIVIYGGMVVASDGSDLTLWLLLGFVVVNLTLAARETHQWYLRKFENYPSNRYAIFPYV